MAEKDTQLDSYISCKASDATLVNITVGGKNAHAHMFTAGGFKPNYTATEEDHMENVTCSVGNNDVEDVLETTKTLYVTGNAF